MNYQKRLKLFEAAKCEIEKRNLPAVEYEKEIKKLCRKYRI